MHQFKRTVATLHSARNNTASASHLGSPCCIVSSRWHCPRVASRVALKLNQILFWLRNAKTHSDIESAMHAVFCSLVACNYYKHKACLTRWHMLIQTFFFWILIILLINISHSFMWLLSISHCGKALVKRTLKLTQFVADLLWTVVPKTNLRIWRECVIAILLFWMQATVPVIVHFPESVMQTARGTSYMLMVVFGSLLGILGLTIIMLILYIYKQ